MLARVFGSKQNQPFCYKLGTTVVLVCISMTLVFIGYVPLLNGLMLIPFAGGLIYLAQERASSRIQLTLALLPTVLIGFFIAIYRPEGFNYPLVWYAEELYPGGHSFSLFVNLSKGLGGYLVIVWLLSGAFNDAKRRSLPPGKLLVVIVTAIVAILALANVAFGVTWSPKLPEGIFHFVVVNLLVTVVAEEAFFRLLLQKQIVRYFQNRALGTGISVGLVSVLFALAHTAAIGPAFLLYLFAGLVYAAVYAKTQKLWASIAVHFGVNILHFTLLQYPL